MLTNDLHNSPKTLILGIGNTLLTDEGIGIHVMRELADSQLLQGNIEFLDGGTLSFTLASPIEECQQFIVIDASEISSKPGTVQVFENEQMDHFISTGNKKSVHEVGLVDVMSIAMLSGRLPAKRALIGIQPDILDWGEAPTGPVQQAIPVACQHVRDLLSKWQS